MTFVRKLPIAGASTTTASFADPSSEFSLDAAPLSYEFATSMTDPGG
ncbi:MAG TPA: hypothetical protein VJ885_17735 [Thermoanaerobaculia bacterium]|jgi:hypothetical protein|nr:hypothetical protein [Thermoanaerobaculia bacterium]